MHRPAIDLFQQTFIRARPVQSSFQVLLTAVAGQAARMSASSAQSKPTNGNRRPPIRFDPLSIVSTTDNSAAAAGRKLKGVVFDVDGTLCKPQSYMFEQMRSALGIVKSVDILDHIYSLPEAAQEEAQQAIRNIERDAMLLQEAQPGLIELMDYLERKEVKMGICTRNFDGPVTHLLEKYLPGKTYHPIVTRDFRPPKPDPAGILHIAKSWGLGDDASGLIMVGDSIDDVEAGFRAGAATVLLENDSNQALKSHPHTGVSIRRLDELVVMLDHGFSERISNP